MKKLLLLLTLIALPGWGQNSINTPKPAEKIPFTVYKEPERDRHFIPSGQIGDADDIKVMESYAENAKEGQYCIRIEYSAQEGRHEKWAGIYWQEPDFNFATVPNVGYNLKGARKITFWARGEKGGERIDVKAGGIKGMYPDSFDMPLRSIELAKVWKKFTIPMNEKDLSYVIGGFFVSFQKKYHPNGAIIYFDDIVYE
jgi:hypothetical protein